MPEKAQRSRPDPELPRVRGAMSTATMPVRPDETHAILEIGARAIHAEFVRVGLFGVKAEERWEKMPRASRENYIREAAALFNALAAAGYEIRRKR